MIEYKKVFLDTAPFIYFIEKDSSHPTFFEKTKRFLVKSFESNIQLFTSAVSIEEYMVYPYKQNRLDYIETFERLLRTLNIETIAIDENIAKKAAQIRAKYTAFKGMDALQLAAAHSVGCDLFLTNDKQLRQFDELDCKTIDELPEF